MADGLMANPYLELLNLGVSPEQAQQQIDQQRALQFANMNPQQRMAAGIYGGLQQVARAFGAKDPMLEQASQIRALQQQFDTQTAEGMAGFARALERINPSLAAQAGQMAEQKRMREAQLGKIEAETAETKRKGTAAEAAVKSRAAALQKRFPEMSEDEALGLAEDTKVVGELLKVPKETARKTKTVTANGRVVLIDETTGETIKDIGAAGKTLEESLGAGLGALGGVLGGAIAKKQAESMGSKGGQLTGEQVAQIQGKEDALTALAEAKGALKSGIYAGKYGPLQEVLAGYAGIGSKQRLANTEYYRTVIGEVVIPRLQEFGGNDSVEELKYLRSVVAGETSLEPAAIQRTLDSAERKIKRGVKRIQEQQQAVQEGRPLPTQVTVPSSATTVDWSSLPSSKGK
jgi:hypothetical protein